MKIFIQSANDAKSAFVVLSRATVSLSANRIMAEANKEIILSRLRLLLVLNSRLEEMHRLREKSTSPASRFVTQRLNMYTRVDWIDRSCAIEYEMSNKKCRTYASLNANKASFNWFWKSGLTKRLPNESPGEWDVREKEKELIIFHSHNNMNHETILFITDDLNECQQFRSRITT